MHWFDIAFRLKMKKVEKQLPAVSLNSDKRRRINSELLQSSITKVSIVNTLRTLQKHNLLADGFFNESICMRELKTLLEM